MFSVSGQSSSCHLGRGRVGKGWTGHKDSRRFLFQESPELYRAGSNHEHVLSSSQLLDRFIHFEHRLPPYLALAYPCMIHELPSVVDPYGYPAWPPGGDREAHCLGLPDPHQGKGEGLGQSLGKRDPNAQTRERPWTHVHRDQRELLLFHLCRFQDRFHAYGQDLHMFPWGVERDLKYVALFRKYGHTALASGRLYRQNAHGKSMLALSFRADKDWLWRRNIPEAGPGFLKVALDLADEFGSARELDVRAEEGEQCDLACPPGFRAGRGEEVELG